MNTSKYLSKSAFTAAGQTDVTRQVITGFADGQIKMWVPVSLFLDDKLTNVNDDLYYETNYSSIKSTGDVNTLLNSGISTIYDPSTLIYGYKSSANVDKKIGVGSTEIKTSSIPPIE